MNPILSQKARRTVERGSILVALLGLALMFQPVVFPLFSAGFWFLFVGGMLYVSTTFWYGEAVTVSGAIWTALKTLLTVAVFAGIAIRLVPVLL